MEIMQQNDLSLSQYIIYRNGLPAGARGSMRNMLYRSFGAPTFAGFWRHWNPIFGYALGRFIYSPLERAMPSALALVATFVFSGAVHDLVTMAVRGSPAFLFTPWFFLLGTGVVLGRAVGLNLSGQPWVARATVNLAYLSVCLAITLAIGYLIA
jgi:D-alanyl-lipoteichoic acid acyltransferase DltB (MBOAT superfamily)